MVCTQMHGYIKKPCKETSIKIKDLKIGAGIEKGNQPITL